MSKPVVAIVGRPNVGKSTLFNRIIRRRKAIVANVPGITRDRNYAVAEYDGRPFILVDTGGFDPGSKDPIMQQMKVQVQLAVEEADRVLLVMDAKEGLTPLDREVYHFLRSRNKTVYPVVNKVDTAKREPETYEFYELGVERVFTVSAEHALGIESLMDEVTGSFARAESFEAQGPLRISVIGRPNAGKSTLINALIGENRLITSEVPGTTRDAIDTLFEYNGQPYVLVDTAGIRRKARITHRIETYSVIMVLKSIEDSDICLILLDAGVGVTDQDARIAGLAHEAGTASIVLVNKWDQVEKEIRRKDFLEEVKRALKFMEYAPVLCVSALTGRDLDRIFPLVQEIRHQHARRVATAEVNRVLRQAVEAHEPPYCRGRRIRFYYGTQTQAAPPTFILFVNAPSGVHFSYLRYLSNTFQEQLGFTKVPVRIFLKKRK